MEEYLKEVKLAKDVEIQKVAVVKFKDFEEFVAFIEKRYEADLDKTYDVGVEEIFYNIWLIRRDLDYGFLGGEFM